MTYAAYKCDLWRMQPSVWETANKSIPYSLKFNMAPNLTIGMACFLHGQLSLRIGVWLPADLTNHNAESAIFVRQTNQMGE